MTVRYPLFCGTTYRGGFWFRVFGYGVKGKDTRINPLLFSEREKLTRFLKLGPYVLGFLSRKRSI